MPVVVSGRASAKTLTNPYDEGAARIFLQSVRRFAIAGSKRERGARLVETCWFCEKQPATQATAYRATVYGNKKDPPSAAGRQVDVSGDTARISLPIARCSSCATFQRRESAITLSGLALGVAIFAGPYALAAFGSHNPPFVFFGSSVATVVTLAIAGFLLGLGAGVLVAARVNRGMPRRDPRSHPDVVFLTNNGWSYDPPNVD
jgi:hypothetical protein